MGMEQDTKEFFALILNSIVLVFVWMMFNVFFGLWWGYAFFDGASTWKNYLYYAISIAGLVWVIIRLYHKWKDR